jgi:YgiT-type zinc finger domain-containing protein
MCGSRKVHRVQKDVAGKWGGRPFLAPNVVFDECDNCGEQFFDHEAMQSIESHYPVRARRLPGRRKAS